MRRGTNVHALGGFNQIVILDTIRRNREGLSRVEIAEQTGLSALAEDHSGDLVVRLYEARGARAVGTVTAGFEVSGVVETDLLERAVADPGALTGVDGPRARLKLRAFQLVTLRFRRAGAY